MSQREIPRLRRKVRGEGGVFGEFSVDFFAVLGRMRVFVYHSFHKEVKKVKSMGTHYIGISKAPQTFVPPPMQQIL